MEPPEKNVSYSKQAPFVSDVKKKLYIKVSSCKEYRYMYIQ